MAELADGKLLFYNVYNTELLILDLPQITQRDPRLGHKSRGISDINAIHSVNDHAQDQLNQFLTKTQKCTPVLAVQTTTESEHRQAQ